MAYQRERLDDARGEVESTRRELVGPIEDWTADLRAGWVALAEPDQIETAGCYAPPAGDLARIDAITMYGLTLCGLFLMAGFLTPLAALGGAGFLFLFYVSMPPFPGLPPNPKAEGTYLFVNKNLIEMIALLALAATPNGLWFGVDRLLFGWIDRRPAVRAAERERVAGRRPRLIHRLIADRSSRTARFPERSLPDHDQQPHRRAARDRPGQRLRRHRRAGDRPPGRLSHPSRLPRRRRRRRPRPGGPLLRLRLDGREARGQGRDHRHRQRGLRRHDPPVEPRLRQLHRLLRRPPLQPAAGP